MGIFLFYASDKVKLGDDPNADYALHFARAQILRHRAKNLPSFVERDRAGVELAIAERTMQRCIDRQGFDASLAASMAQSVRTQAATCAPRMRTVRDERDPDTSKLPAFKRTARNMAPKHVPVWPLMRTRGNMPFGLIG